MKQLVTTIAALLIGTAPALAGSYTAAPMDAVVPALPSAPVTFNWTGGYAGAFVGAVHGNNQWSASGGAAFSTPGDWSGTPAGVMLGYNWQTGAMVYGAELDYTAATLTAVSTSSGGFGCATGCQTDVSRLMTIRARVGFAMDRTMFYGTAGYARANGLGSVAGTATITGDASVNGWSAGVGMEHALTNRFTIRAEYLHTDLGRLELPTGCGGNCYTDIRVGQVRLGAAFRF